MTTAELRSVNLPTKKQFAQVGTTIASVVQSYCGEACKHLADALKANAWLQKAIGKGTEGRKEKISWPGPGVALGDGEQLDYFDFIEFCASIVNAVGRGTDDPLLDAQV